VKTVVLIPALRPGEHLADVVGRCMALGLGRVLVVDDGSGTESAAVFEAVAALGAAVARHPSNRGKGAALKTGMAAALEAFPDLTGVVTADADGQHAPEDILRVAQALERHPDNLVLGARALSKDEAPLRSRFGNRFSAGMFFLMTGQRCHDTQTGLRGLGRGILDFALEIPGERYDYEMNLLVESARQGIPLEMLEIRTIYYDNNSGSHFRVVRDSALIYQGLLKYLAVALGSSLVDLGLFALLAAFVFCDETAGIWAATAVARCISGAVNFKLNQVWCFRPRRRTGGQLGRYGVLFVGCIVASSALVSLLDLLPIPLPLVKAAVDTALFAVNYQVQKRWVFSE